jgi:hypothetical protein
MKQVVSEIKVSLIDYKENYTETSNLLAMSGKAILTNPKLINSGKMILDTTPKFEMVRAMSCDFIEIASNKPMYIKIILDEDFDPHNHESLLAQFTLKTSRFSYSNKEQPIMIALGNGSMDVSESDGKLLLNNNSVEQTVEFVIGSSELSYLNTDFSAWSNLTGGEF